MTVEEKAKDLMVKAFNAVNEWHTDWSVLFHKQKTKPFKAAKRAAIVVCDEVIRELNDIVFNYDFENTPTHAHPSKTVIPFWHKVKKHIEDNY